MHVANIWGDGEKNYHQPLTEMAGTETPGTETSGSETYNDGLSIYYHPMHVANYLIEVMVRKITTNL